ncbi:zinc finger, C2H2 type domain-containing protein [Cryptosporidium felis]|nr:zinc finger, C2H2 type domain-containing protein [Cryptosporidium felis]
MGRKKRKVAEIKPFCYYCNREFGDEKVLKQHQKIFRLFPQVHKETLSRIPNAVPGRDIPDIVINGMKGVPPELIAERVKEQNVEIDIQKDIRNFNPHGNKMLALMNEVAKEFVKEHNLGDIRVPGMYGGPEFIFGAMIPFPNQSPIPGVMVPRLVENQGKTAGNYEIILKFPDSDTSPEELYASKLFDYHIIRKYLPINIALAKN